MSFLRLSPLALLNTKLHVVLGTEGEYSDRNVYVAGIFTDLEMAKRLVVEKTAEGRQRANDRGAWVEKRNSMLKELQARKIEELPPSVIAYFGKNYLPASYTMPTADETAAIDATMGQIPESIDYDYYEIVTVPVDKWGRFSEYDDEIDEVAS